MVSKRIVYIQYTSPAVYPPLQHSSRLLARAGWQVLFLGTSGLGVDNLKFSGHPNIAVRQLEFVHSGWRQKLHYLWYILWVIGWTLRWQANWIYASELLACPIALFLSFIPGLRVIYHEHDSVPKEQTKQLSSLMKLACWSRRNLARRAIICVLPNEQRARLFTRTVASGKQSLTVWNCPSLEEVSYLPKVDFCPPLKLYYHGNISRNLIPLTLLDAISQFDGQVELHIVGYETFGNIGYIDEFKEKAKILQVENCVHFRSALPRHKLLEFARHCDVGLALMPMRHNNINFRFMVGASNKPFDYLACGLALLVSDLPAWRKLYAFSGYGLACNPDDPASITVALRWFLDHRTEMRTMGARGQQKIATEWNYETQFAKVYDVLNHS